MKFKQVANQTRSLANGFNLSEEDVVYIFEHGRYLYKEGREIISLSAHEALPEDQNCTRFRRLDGTTLILNSQQQIVGVERRRSSKVRALFHR